MVGVAYILDSDTGKRIPYALNNVWPAIRGNVFGVEVHRTDACSDLQISGIFGERIARVLKKAERVVGRERCDAESACVHGASWNDPERGEGLAHRDTI